MSELSVLRPGDPAWPVALEQADPPPLELWVRGTFPSTGRKVAIVGTRVADPPALSFAKRLARELARHGIVVVSGGARGIDAAAHRGALEGGGATVVVLPGGLDYPAPPSHGPLFQEVVDHRGALVSEHAPDEPPHRSRFVTRNRIIAALSAVTIVVRAPYRSGALSTAAYARGMGRSVMAVPAAPWDIRGAGCLALLQSGATVCADAADVLTLLGTRPMFPTDPVPQPPLVAASTDPAEDRVLRALEEGPLHPDEIMLRTGLSGVEVRRAIAALMITGRIRREGGCVALPVEGAR